MSSLRRRNLPGGSSPAGSMEALRRFKKLDIYRKVPRDLTEGSVTGGCVTFFAVVFLVFLTFAELRAMMQVSLETTIVVDRSEDQLLRVNLNMTLLGLACQFVHVEAKNVLGVQREVDDLTLHKFALDHVSTWVGSATKKEEEVNHTYQGTNLDHYGNTRHAIELNGKTFQTALDDYEALVVDFHSPRCIHCVRFAPIFEHAADLVKQRAPKRRDSHRKHAVALATVDCIENFDLCRAQHIQAYPTVLVFRTIPGSKRDPALTAQGLEDMEKYWSLESRKQHRFEMYQGVREAEAISAFAVKVLEEVISADETLGKDAFTRVGAGSDVNEDGSQDSVVHTPGCRIEGYLDVRRVPGSLFIRPYSASGHEMDTGLISVDHRIDHLSFGPRAFDITDEGPYSGQQERPVMLLPGEKTESYFGFRGKTPGETHVHNLKVVSKTLIQLSGKSTTTFEYSIASDSYKPADKIPFVVFDYDLSPLQVSTREIRRGWVEGVTAVLALVGGVFSSSFIIEGIVSMVASWISVKGD